MEIRTAASFLRYYEHVRERTMRVVESIPADRVEWTCSAGQFTLGDLARHLATTERYVFAECVAGRPNRYPGCGRDLADGLDEVLALMRRLHAQSVEIFAALNDDDLAARRATPEGQPVTTWKLLRGMVEHEIHHRGQIYVYLGILGVAAPSLYGLTAEQVRALSVEPA